MELPLDGQRGEDVIVDEGGAQVSEDPRGVLLDVLKQVACDHVVQDRVAKKLQPEGRRKTLILQNVISPIISCYHSLFFHVQKTGGYANVSLFYVGYFKYLTFKDFINDNPGETFSTIPTLTYFLIFFLMFLLLLVLGSTRHIIKMYATFSRPVPPPPPPHSLKK